MHWSRELLALTAGVRWRIAGLVAVGLLIVAASLASFVFAGRAIAAVFAGQAWRGFWSLIAAAAVAAVVRGVLLHLRETAGERTAAAVKQALRTRLYRHAARGRRTIRATRRRAADHRTRGTGPGGR